MKKSVGSRFLLSLWLLSIFSPVQELLGMWPWFWKVDCNDGKVALTFADDVFIIGCLRDKIVGKYQTFALVTRWLAAVP